MTHEEQQSKPIPHITDLPEVGVVEDMLDTFVERLRERIPGLGNVGSEIEMRDGEVIGIPNENALTDTNPISEVSPKST